MNDFLLEAQSLSDNFEKDIEFILNNTVSSGFSNLVNKGRNSGDIILIDETKQHSGSFKYRGALLGVSKNLQGVVASGSGNFPIAVGHASSRLGVSAILFMPEDAPHVKKEMVLASGSQVIFKPRMDFVHQAELAAISNGLPLLHPFKDKSMLIGSCSLGIEIAHAIKTDGSPDDAVVVACGGGGLAAGTALGLRISGLKNDIYAAEPENYPSLQAALNLSYPVNVTPHGHTVCDALRVTQIGDLAFNIIQKVGIHTLSVTDEAVSEAQKYLQCETVIKAEPSGALALAAITTNKLSKGYRKLWVLVCGGNI
ncbi:pyridoxal-phosphate dependent enzyme [Brucellaceae bacterium C25G]